MRRQHIIRWARMLLSGGLIALALATAPGVSAAPLFDGGGEPATETPTPEPDTPTPEPTATETPEPTPTEFAPDQVELDQPPPENTAAQVDASPEAEESGGLNSVLMMVLCVGAIAVLAVLGMLLFPSGSRKQG